MAVDKIVKIHPVVLFQIADAYERRSQDNHRVIGTLLGKEFGYIFKKVTVIIIKLKMCMVDTFYV